MTRNGRATQMSELPAIDTWRVSMTDKSRNDLLTAGNISYPINGAVLSVLLAAADSMLMTDTFSPILRNAVQEALDQGYKSFPE